MRRYGVDRRWPFAEGGGTTILAFTIILAVAVLAWLFYPVQVTGVLVALAAVLWLLILYFFRDPNRVVRNEPGVVLAPGDGKVVAVVREREDRYLQADATRISLFLSITDVHVQRAPLGGHVALVEWQPGKFLQAFKPEASNVNESIAMVIDTAYGRLLVKQIAGILARRCVNLARPGDEIKIGQRFGLIRFSSRVDLFLPPEAQLLVVVGDKVKGGLTPVAHLASQA